jgi:disulfide bond formation protein DsbB
MEFGIFLTKLLSIATVLGNVLVGLLFLAFLFARPLYRRVMRMFAAYGVLLAALMASGATVGSLIYSEVVGFPACILCWIQRGFMYPLMLVLLFGAWKPRHRIVPIALGLSIAGGAVALYNWVKDMMNVYLGYSAPCPAVSGLPSCDRIYVLEYGYVTIAMFALNIFVLVGILMYAVMQKEKFSTTKVGEAGLE